MPTAPEPEPTPRPQRHCPRCGATLKGNPAYFAAHAVEALHDLAVLLCEACSMQAVDTEVIKIEMAWRPEGQGLKDQLAADGFEALKLRRMLDSDESDPMWRRR